MWRTSVVFLLTLSCATAQDALLSPPPGQVLKFRAHAVGRQIYTCKAVAGDFAWTLKAPEAKLFDGDNRIFGRHFEGPTWEANDGSRVVGKATSSIKSPDPASIPWLQIEVIRHDGQGTMSPVIGIQRLNTKGGKAPATGCDNPHAGVELQVPYEAYYYFYQTSK